MFSQYSRLLDTTTKVISLLYLWFWSYFALVHFSVRQNVTIIEIAKFTEVDNQLLNVPFSQKLAYVETLVFDTFCKNFPLIVRSLTQSERKSAATVKTMLNNGEKRRKTSTLDSLLARDLLWCIIILIVLCTTSAVVSQEKVYNVSIHWDHSYFRYATL